MKRLLIIIPLLFLCLPVHAQAGPTFFYVVRTVDVNGFESANSNQATATFSSGQTKVNLAWTAAVVPSGGAAIAGYNIYRSTTTGGPYTKVNGSLVSGVTYTDPFVIPNAPSGVTAGTS